MEEESTHRRENRRLSGRSANRPSPRKEKWVDRWRDLIVSLMRWLGKISVWKQTAELQGSIVLLWQNFLVSSIDLIDTFLIYWHLCVDSPKVVNSGQLTIGSSGFSPFGVQATLDYMLRVCLQIYCLICIFSIRHKWLWLSQTVTDYKLVSNDSSVKTVKLSCLKFGAIPV